MVAELEAFVFISPLLAECQKEDAAGRRDTQSSS